MAEFSTTVASSTNIATTGSSRPMYLRHLRILTHTTMAYMSTAIGKANLSSEDPVLELMMVMPKVIVQNSMKNTIESTSPTRLAPFASTRLRLLTFATSFSTGVPSPPPQPLS